MFQAIVTLIAAAAAALGLALNAHVHSERWSVRTLADGFRPSASPTRTTIAAERARPAPVITESTRRQPSERELLQLTCELVSVREEFDHDLHLVLRDPKSGGTLVAEIPYPDPSLPTDLQATYRAARRVIERLVGEAGFAGRAARPGIVLEVVGIGFFDDPHAIPPEGTAPNAREIHPVLSLRVLATE